MGRISDVIPALYFGGENELEGFLRSLDLSVDEAERKIKLLPSLIDIDSCPDDKLPYLAAQVNCPLVGTSAHYWRTQLRNWPFILKLKGTEKSLILALESIGAGEYSIRTYWRNESGGYTADKPEGEPFLNQADGLWHNSRTHYFGVSMELSREYLEEQGFRWEREDIIDKLGVWMERAKPYHAELLNISVTTPPPMQHGHACRWAVCTFLHSHAKQYAWGELAPFEPMSDTSVIDCGRTIQRPRNAPHRMFDAWANTRWGHFNFKGTGLNPGTMISVAVSVQTEFSAAEAPKRTWRGLRTWRRGTWRSTGDTSMSIDM